MTTQTETLANRDGEFMPSASEEYNRALQRSREVAAQCGSGKVLATHLLVTLLEDPECSSIFERYNYDPEAIKSSLLGKSTPRLETPNVEMGFIAELAQDLVFDRCQELEIVEMKPLHLLNSLIDALDCTAPAKFAIEGDVDVFLLLNEIDFTRIRIRSEVLVRYSSKTPKNTRVIK
ncbi:MAG: hypothetical protein Q7S79_00440 [bacterium]|nr:hypothetical protein [bacterium]